MAPAPKPTCELYLVITAAQTATARLEAALGAHTVASVLIRPDSAAGYTGATPLIAAAQAHGAAALLQSDAGIAQQLKADGVHIPLSRAPLEAYRAARDQLRGGAIVGAEAGKSRHDAMSLGEAGVDYVSFGIPPQVKDIAGAEARRLDMIAWWAEIFEIPCVAFDVASADAAAALARTGADFLAVTLEPGLSAADTRAFLTDIATALAVPHAAA
jgi:thiamine-phosphate pyrophosphorylase